MRNNLVFTQVLEEAKPRQLSDKREFRDLARHTF
jgi:hypothetical protein